MLKTINHEGQEGKNRMQDARYIKYKFEALSTKSETNSKYKFQRFKTKEF